MEENKMEKYTFGENEKEILNILGSFEQELEQKDRDTNNEIRYYNNFTFNGKTVDGLKNIFITIERNEDGEIIGYNVYSPDMKKILSTDENGQITECIEELEKVLGKIDIRQLIQENEIGEDEKPTGRLKGISEKSEPEELQRSIDKEDEHGYKIRQQDGEEQLEENDEQEKDDETKLVEENLNQQGEDLRITSYRKIKDSKVSERMPEVFQNGVENGIAFSKTLNRYVIISKINGNYQLNENIQPAQMTWKTITSISPDGEKIERRVPHALMRIQNNDKKEIAVTIGQYGDVDIETIDVLSCQERIARSVREDGEDIKEEEHNDVTREFQTEGIQYQHEIAHKIKILKEEYNVTEINIDEVKDLNIEKLIEEEADRVKMSKEGFRNYVKQASGKTIKEKISNAQEEIVDEYMGRRRPR